MTEYPHDNDVAIGPVPRAAEERIRREALRQLDTVDIDDDDSRMEPLPTFSEEAVIDPADITDTRSTRQ